MSAIDLRPSFTLTAKLCALPEVTLKDGHEYIRRDAVVDLIAQWRRAIDMRLCEEIRK